MGRLVRIALAAVIGALAVAGCGATGAASDSGVLAAQAGTLEQSPGDHVDPGGVPRHDGAGAACPNPDLAPAPATLPAIADATLCLLNGERADHGLAPLAPNRRLAAAATAYAGDLVAGSYFSHTGRDGSGLLDRIERTGYVRRDAGWVLGENLAWGTGELATPGSIMQAWMQSPGHRDNILSGEYREVGIGVVAGNPARVDGQGATYATEFGAIEGGSPSARRHRAKRARRHVRRGPKAREARRGGKHRRGDRRRLKLAAMDAAA
jgi:uncharacterized protein YkwD